MSTSEPQPTEEELRAYEAEIKKIRIEQVLLENVVTMVNLGMRRTGLAPGTEDERDVGQVRLAIEAIRVVMPLLGQFAPQQVGPIRDALSQLQLAYVKIGGTAPAPEESDPAPDAAQEPPAQPGQSPPQAGDAGPAQRSGRLWIPGQ